MSLAGLERTCGQDQGGEVTSGVAGSNEPDEDRVIETDEDKVKGRGCSSRGLKSTNCIMFK